MDERDSGVVLFVILKKHPSEAVDNMEVVQKVVFEKSKDGERISKSTTFSSVAANVEECARTIFGDFCHLYNVTYEEISHKGAVVHTVLVHKDNLDCLHLSVVPTKFSDGVSFKEVCLHYTTIRN